MKELKEKWAEFVAKAGPLSIDEKREIVSRLNSKKPGEREKALAEVLKRPYPKPPKKGA